MPKVKLSEVARLQDEQDVKCRSCNAPAEEEGIYCRSCHDYWTVDAPAMAEIDFERDWPDETAPAA